MILTDFDHVQMKCDIMNISIKLYISQYSLKLNRKFKR